jgi:hypothetical protein
MLQPAVQTVLKHTSEFRNSCDAGLVVKGKGNFHPITGHEGP